MAPQVAEIVERARETDRLHRFGREPREGDRVTPAVKIEDAADHVVEGLVGGHVGNLRNHAMTRGASSRTVAFMCDGMD